MSLYLSIYFHCLPLDTQPTRDLNLNLSSPALTDCKTELDCLMTKESSSCEHKTPTVYCSVKHWPEDTHTHIYTHIPMCGFIYSPGHLLSAPFDLSQRALETWDALSLWGKMPFSDKVTMLDTWEIVARLIMQILFPFIAATNNYFHCRLTCRIFSRFID